MNEFEWVKYIPTDIHDGLQFTLFNRDDKTIYTMVIVEGDSNMHVTWGDGSKSVNYSTDGARENVLRGHWVEV